MPSETINVPQNRPEELGYDELMSAADKLERIDARVITRAQFKILAKKLQGTIDLAAAATIGIQVHLSLFHPDQLSIRHLITVLQLKFFLSVLH